MQNSQSSFYQNQDPFKPYYLCPHLHDNFLKGLTEPEIVHFMKIVGHPKYLEPGEKIRLAGQTFNDIYVVKSGSIKDSTLSDDGNEYVADFYITGEIIGLEDISNNYSLYDSIALETSSVWVIPFRELLKLAEGIPKLRHRIMLLISKKLANRTQNFLACHNMAEFRLKAFLLNLAERHGTQRHSLSEFYLSMTRQEIGSYLNLTTETVSRIMSKLQKEGFLKADKKRITLLDLGKNQPSYLSTPHNYSGTYSYQH